MKTKDPNERTWLKGLAVECPYGKALPGCHLSGLRSLPTIQIKHIIGFDDEHVRPRGHDF